MQTLRFDVSLGDNLNFSAPVILTTQMGQPAATDTYRFIDATGTTVGHSVNVTYPATGGIGFIEWKFYTASGGTSAQAPGNRNVQLAAFSLSDFGVNATNASQVVAFEQQLKGQSDVAFVAYNKALLSILAPDLKIDLSGLAGPLTLGVPYSGSFTCANIGAAEANANTTCAVTGLPAGLLQGACTIDPPAGGTSWTAGSSIPKGSVVTCAVSGTPTAAGDVTVSGSTGGNRTTTNHGTLADSDLGNNTATMPLAVLAPDMQVTSVDLPAGTEGASYSGSFVCTNAGKTAAAAPTCTPGGLPAWATVACTPDPLPASLAVNGIISCTVTGTPPTGSNGTTAVTITAGTSSTESNTANNTGSGNIVIAGVPDVVIDLGGLPSTGTVDAPYSGTFTCENKGTAAAASAPCTAANLPDGVTVGACTISPPTPATPWSSPGAIGVGEIVTCTVSGTPTKAGESEVSGTGGTSTATTTVTVAAAAAVPLMSAWGLALMASLLAGLGLVRSRRTGRPD